MQYTEIYSPEFDQWFLNEFQLEHYRKCYQEMKAEQSRFPLSQEEVEEQMYAWKTLGTRLMKDSEVGAEYKPE